MDEQTLRTCLHKLEIAVIDKSNDWLRAHCPYAPYFHRHGMDRHPSFGVYIGNNSVYNCFTCHMHGSISDLAHGLGHYKFGNQWHYQEIIEIADKEKILLEELPLERDLPQEPLVEEIFDNMYYSALDYQEARDYLHSRGISDKTTEELDLKFDEQERRILFQIRNPSGLLFGFSGRSIGSRNPKVRDYAGLAKRQHILGCHRWDWNSRKPLMLVEGLFAYAHLVELNVEKVADVGAILGSYLTDWKKELIIKRNTDTFLLMDNDEAGEICIFGKKLPLGIDKKSGALYKLSNQGFKVTAPEYFGDIDNVDKRTLWNIIQGKARERRDTRNGNDIK